LVVVDINCVIVDCADPDRLAEFWSAVLDRPVVARSGPYVWLERRNGLGVGFQRTDGSKAGKNRLHLDLESEHPAAEQARVEALGGRRLTEYDAGGFLVMADPEGNEFCVIPKGPFELDDEGRADYLGEAEPGRV
jgi:predicted enzyme related to lactoylglutathione lyase